MSKFVEPLVVGKFYKRINGQKCLCAYINPATGLPHTLSVNKQGTPFSIVQHSDIFGGVTPYGRGRDEVSQRHSIEGEWVDPIPLVEKWANIYPDGTAVTHSTKESAMKNAMRGARTILMREVVDS